MDNSGKSKFPAILQTAIFIVLIIGLSVLVFQERGRRTALEKELASTMEAKEAMALSLEDAGRENRALKENLEEQKKQAEDLAVSLTESKQERESLTVKINQLNEELASRKSAEELTKQIDTLQQDKMELRMQLEQIQLAKQALEEKIIKAETEGVVKLSAVVVSPDTVKEKPRVLLVNSKYNFVVIGLGNGDGIRAGDILTVHRKQQFVGKVKVEEVRDNVSAASILPEWNKGKIRKNDSVRKD